MQRSQVCSGRYVNQIGGRFDFFFFFLGDSANTLHDKSYASISLRCSSEIDRLFSRDLAAQPKLSLFLCINLQWILLCCREVRQSALSTYPKCKILWIFRAKSSSLEGGRRCGFATNQAWRCYNCWLHKAHGRAVSTTRRTANWQMFPARDEYF